MIPSVSGSGLIHELSIESTVSRVILDIKSILTEISYYESIDEPSPSMSLSLADGVGLKTVLPVIGGETVRFSLSDSDKESNRIIGKMLVYKMTGKTRIHSGVDVYDMFLTTPEMLNDSYEVIEDFQDNQTISSMVRKIFQNSISGKTEKKLNTVEDTDGLYYTTFNRISPFSTLMHLANEAKSADRRSTSNYFFFGNSRGYTFASFQYLMRQPSKKIYYYLHDRIEDDRQFDRNRIISMEEPVGFDLLNGIINGQFSTQILSLDPVAKRFRTNEYLYNRDYGNVDHLGRYPRLSPESSQRFGTIPSREKFIISNSYQGTIPYIIENDSDMQNTYRRRQDFLGQETASKADLLSNVTKILVHGDSSLAAGDTIIIQIPKSGEMFIRDRQTDGFSGGKYLITALSHRFGPGGMSYVTAIECVKDAYSQPVDGRA